jgi:hypothetical protein
MPRHTTAALVMAAALAACSEVANSTGMISQRLGDAARTPGAAEVDLGQLTSFGWDRVYAFKPGATREAMCKFLGASRNACVRIIRLEKTPDAHVAMVYDLRGQVTHFEFHALANGRFDFSFGDNGIPRTAAVFRVRHSTGASEFGLELK